MKFFESMQTTYRILIILSLLIIFQASVHCQRKVRSQIKTTVEGHFGIGTSSDIREPNSYLNIRRTIKYNYGIRFYTEANKKFSLGYGLSILSKGYKEVRNRFGFFGTTDLEVTNLETHWHLGVPLLANFKLTESKSKFTTYFESGLIPSVKLRRVFKEYSDLHEEREIRKTDLIDEISLISTTSFVCTYDLSKSMSIILRPTFRYEIRIGNINGSQRNYNELSIDIGVRQNLYNWGHR